PAILIRPSEALPFGRPCRTHLNRPRKLLTVMKRVGPCPARRLALRRVSHRSLNRHSLPDFTSDSSSSGSSLDSSSDTFLGLPLDSLLDTSSAHSSGVIPYSSSERSLDSSSLFVRPSHKICISLTTSVPSSTPISRSIAPTHVDLLPPRKREEGEGFEVEASARATMEIVVNPLVISGIFESTRGDVLDLKGTLYDIVHYMLEVPFERITEFETAQRQLEAGQLMASGERASLTDRIRRLGRENLRVALLCIERDRFDSLHHHMALSHEEFC
nr:hypothetical protein [Tanacetum cinerariifolium]